MAGSHDRNAKRRLGPGKGMETVSSYLAEPSRPKGEHGPRQPILPDPPVYPPVGRSDDRALAVQVRAVLEADGRLAEHARLGVQVGDGVVHLTGNVEREFQRTLATALAQSVPGVLSVQNAMIASET